MRDTKSVIEIVVRYNAIELHTKQYFCHHKRLLVIVYYTKIICNELRGFEGRNMKMLDSPQYLRTACTDPHGIYI